MSKQIAIEDKSFDGDKWEPFDPLHLMGLNSEDSQNAIDNSLNFCVLRFLWTVN